MPGKLALTAALLALAALAPSAAATTERTKRHRTPGFLIADVRHGHEVAIRARPGGPVIARVHWETEFGSRQSLAVVKSRKKRWLAVKNVALGNHRLGWVDAAEGKLRYRRTRVWLEADLSERTLTVFAQGRIVRRMVVAIGRPGSPTPTGRFSITDKLSGPQFGSYYGCCILALSGRQPNLPAGWRGGDRLAIHGSPTAVFGQAVSAGCLRAARADLLYLMRVVPLGAQVLIHG